MSPGPQSAPFFLIHRDVAGGDGKRGIKKPEV